MLLAGVDVGGTYIKLGLVDHNGRVLQHDKIETTTCPSPDESVQRIRQSLARQLEQLGNSFADVNGIGLGTPGPLDIRTGVVISPSNLPAWRNFPIRDRLSAACDDVAVTFTNDANAAAFGEYWIGCGHAARSLLLLTLGTGVGGGIIIDDRMLEGCHSSGAEVGHICINHAPDARMCGCGVRGHLEAYASATALGQRAAEALRAGEPSSLRDAASDGEPLSGLVICQHADDDDGLALRLVQETAKYLAWGIADLAHVIDPEIIVLGGAMNFGGPTAPLGQHFIGWIADEVRRRTFPLIAQNLNIVFSSLGGDAGFIGAAGWARQSLLRT